VRGDEIWEAFHLIRQVLDELGDLGASPWATPTGPVNGEAFGWAEAPQGEVLYLVHAEHGVLTRVKPRSASFHNLALFTAAFPRDITTDFAFIEASFGLSIAGAAG
jgi:formate hydrogenlyase subunit 5